MAKTYRVNTHRLKRTMKRKLLYGGNQHGPDTPELMRRIARSATTNMLDLTNLIITSLPPLPPTLTDLNIFHTQITSLPQLPTTLKRLNVSRTPLTSLPPLPPTLNRLYLVDIPITSLPQLPPTLEALDISRTQITSLPQLPTTLRWLNVSNTPITSLPQLPPTLTDLNVSGTSIPPMLPRENISQYNIRMMMIKEKARDLSAAQQTILRPGSSTSNVGATTTTNPALQRLMSTDILKKNLTPMLTGKSGEESNVFPSPSPTAMQQLKKEVTGRYGGRTKKNKYI